MSDIRLFGVLSGKGHYYGKEDYGLGHIGFGYQKTDYRFVSWYKNGAWDQGTLVEDPNFDQ
jgi:hypothetical protein